MPLVCSKCGAKNLEGARFCKGCGASIATVPPIQSPIAEGREAGRQCLGCGMINSAAAKFCRACGAAISVPVPVASKVDSPSAPPVERALPTPAATKSVLSPANPVKADPPAPAAAKAAVSPTPPVEVEPLVSVISQAVLPPTPPGEVQATAPRSGTSFKHMAMLLTGFLLVALGLGGWLFLGKSDVQSSEVSSPAEAVLPSVSKTIPSVQMPSEPLLSSSSASQNEIPAPSVAGVPSGLPAQEPTTSSSEIDRAASAQAEMAAAERARQTLQRLQREERERIAAFERQRATLELERQRVEVARQRADEAARREAQLEAERAQIKPLAATSTLTVESACSGARNIVYREICRINECRKNSFAADPICVMFRKAEEANRQNREYQ